MNHNRENNQNMGENLQHGEGFQNNRSTPANRLPNVTNQQGYQNKQMNAAHQMNQQIDEQHMFNTLMQNANTRQRLIEMYQELMGQQQAAFLAQNNVQIAQPVDIQNSYTLELQQFVNTTHNNMVNNVVPFDQIEDSMDYRRNFHQHYQIKKKIGEGGQGSVYSGKQRLY